MTNTYKNVYIEDTATIAGVYEAEGPLAKYFDKSYTKDLYFGEKSWEQAEIRLLKDTISLMLDKTNKKDSDINLIISGDLQNQIASSDYAIREFDIPFLGIYNACATSSEGMIIGATFIDNKSVKNCLVSTVSHNTSAEKQYRNPTEYGTPKPETATFTVTGGSALLLTSKKTKIKLTASTIGRIIDKGTKDVNHMGAVMVPAAADTIYCHLKDLDRNPDYYDLILTGDLSHYGKKIMETLLQEDHQKYKEYNDCGCLLYDEHQPVYQGGSGPVCSALVSFGYIVQQMIKGRYQKVLFLTTGALLNPVMTNQKLSIPCVSHGYALEVVT